MGPGTHREGVAGALPARPLQTPKKINLKMMHFNLLLQNCNSLNLHRGKPADFVFLGLFLCLWHRDPHGSLQEQQESAQLL